MVVITLNRPYLDRSDTEPAQAAKDVLESPDALMEIFERIESFFRRLEEYAKALTIKTESMMAVLVKITVEVLGIFAILTKEIKDGKKRKSQSIIDRTSRSSVADKDAVRYLKNYLKSLIGRADISGTLKKLDRLTNEEFMMAVTEILKSVKCIQSGVEGATRKIDELDRKIVEYQAGTFSTSTKIDELLAELARKFDERWAGTFSTSTLQCHPKPTLYTTSRSSKESS